MKKILLAITALSSLVVAAPATAQPGNQASVSFDVRIERLENRLRGAVQQGVITRDQGWTFAQQLDRLDDMFNRYRRDGLSIAENQELMQRLSEIRRQIRLAAGNRIGRDGYSEFYDDDGPGYGYGSGPGYGYGQGDRIDRNNDGFDDRDLDRDGRWDDDLHDRIDRNNDGFDDRDLDRDGRWDDDLATRIDRNNDGFDDRDYDRDGRWDDDLANRIDNDRDGYDDRDFDRDGHWDDDIAEGRNAPFPGNAPVQDRGVVGTLIDTLLGGGAATLRVGDPAPDNLGGVPYAQQQQFRDGNGVYYRSDGRAIYEIDAYTRRVRQIYAIPR